MLRCFDDACGCRTTPRCKVLSIESDLEVHPQPLYCKVRLVEISDAYGDDLERYLNPMPQTSVGPSSANTTARPLIAQEHQDKLELIKEANQEKDLQHKVPVDMAK